MKISGPSEALRPKSSSLLFSVVQNPLGRTMIVAHHANKGGNFWLNDDKDDDAAEGGDCTKDECW